MRLSLPFPVVVLLCVLVLTAVRQLVRVRLPIWIIMLAGAAAVLAAGRISPRDALLSINADVMLFLFGMFVLGKALDESGLLLAMAYRLFGRTRRTGGLVMSILFGGGILSAFLMNDTIAVIGTPLVLYFSRTHRISPKLLLLTLAFAVTTGSVMSPIGNPQNLLIALHVSMRNPFVTFAGHLALPTLAGLLLAFLALRLGFPGEFHDKELNHVEEAIKDPRLAALCRISLAILAFMIAAKVAVVAVGLGFDFRLTYIALAACAPLLLVSRRRWVLLKGIDWTTLVFFASMFVLMKSVWMSGFLQSLIDGRDLASVPAILGLSVAGSQIVSNVPFVALYLPLLANPEAHTPLVMALAAGSTIAGNLLVLGAASNVIIIQAAETEARRSGTARAVQPGAATLSFMDFARVGVPLTLAQTAVYWAALAFLP
jgi:Na+/H+ antiporter NhaD/arsenite permease-like protein